MLWLKSMIWFGADICKTVLGHCKDVVFYSGWDVEVLQSFEQNRGMIALTFWKAHFELKEPLGGYYDNPD